MIPFSQYMAQSLYGQGGYYTDSARVGKAGDFYTSVSASKFFGGAIASYILSLLESQALTLPLRIVEIGADKGYLLGDIALFLDALGEVLPECEFIIIEPLHSLSCAQKAHFQSLHFSSPIRFHIAQDFSLVPHCAQTSLFVIANELFDSLPCDVLDSHHILSISTSDTGAWHGVWQELNAGNLHALIPQKSRALLETLGLDPLHFRGVVPQWNECIHALAAFAKAHKHGYVVSFDYGGVNPPSTYSSAPSAYNPLHANPRFYASHQVISLQEFLKQEGDFRALYKCADITYDVEFLFLDSLLCHYGFKKVFYDTQAKVLLEKMRILELLESFLAQLGHSAYLREINKVKTLLHTLGGRFFGMCYKIS